MPRIPKYLCIKVKQDAKRYKVVKHWLSIQWIERIFGINRYFKDAEMGPHADQADGNLSLRYSIVTYLNDDYEGGEIEFPNQSIKIKPVAGSSIIFPSSAPYLHRSHKIISGKKYMCPSFWLW